MYSITQSGNLIALVGTILMLLGFSSEESGQITETIGILIPSVISLLGILTSWYGRFRKGDITIFGFRKKV